MEKKTNKKELVKWMVTIGIVAFLVITGLHKPIISGIQKAILATGIVQPDIEIEKSISKKKIDLNVLLVNEQGAVVNLNDFKGKVLFINFWATWCPPCRAEMPGIQNLYEKFRTRDIAFVMVSSDRAFQSAIDYKKENGFSFPIYQLKSAMPVELESQVLPSTYVLNREGQIVVTETGMAKYDSDKFVAFITGLLKK